MNHANRLVSRNCCGLLLAWALGLVGCGHYPSTIDSRGDLARISKNETHLRVFGLPARDVAALAKFRDLYEIDFEGGAADEHLAELGKLALPRLAQVVLTDCPEAGDRGVAALPALPALIGLGLRGTGVGDEGCRTIAAKMKVQSVNVSRSPKVTAAGLLALVRAEHLSSLGFSLHELSQADLLEMIRQARALERMEIEIVGNADRRLDLPALRKAAQEKKIMLLGVRSQSASAL